MKYLLLVFCFPTILLAQSQENKKDSSAYIPIQSGKNIYGDIDSKKVEVQLGMSDRRIISIPQLQDTLPKILRVVVEIKADREGNVIWARATLKGSTTSDSSLLQLAEEATLKLKVNADPLAPIEQSGTVTYSFRVK